MNILRNLWTEIKNKLRKSQSGRRWSSARRESFGEPSKGITKKCRKFFDSQYRKISQGPFFVFLEVSDVSVEVFGAAFLSCADLLVSHKVWYHKKLRTFRLQEKVP